MRFGTLLMVMVISLLPRIPLAIAIPGRTFDLRFEDIILVFLLILWFVSLFHKPFINLTVLFQPIVFYLSIVICTTMAAMFTFDLNPIRTLLYFSKELQFILIFLFIANWIYSESDIRLVSRSLLFSGVLNMLWVGYQVSASDYHSLFSAERELPSEVYLGQSRLESYGPHLIGEGSPLSTGGFFMLVFLLTLSFLLFGRANKWKSFYAVLSFIFLICIALSFSRSSMIGAVIGAAALLSQTQVKRKIKWILISCFVLGIVTLLLNQTSFVSVMTEQPGIRDRLSYEGIGRAMNERVYEIWLPLLDQSFHRALLGFGKGSLAFLEQFPADPHNHYIRVFIESGILGFMAFLWLLAMIIALSAGVLKKGERAIHKVIGGTTFAATLGLIFAALFEDAFMPVLLNELWWILVGLTAAAQRVDTHSKPDSKLVKESLPHLLLEPRGVL